MPAVHWRRSLAPARRSPTRRPRRPPVRRSRSGAATPPPRRSSPSTCPRPAVNREAEARWRRAATRGPFSFPAPRSPAARRRRMRSVLRGGDGGISIGSAAKVALELARPGSGLTRGIAPVQADRKPDHAHQLGYVGHAALGLRLEALLFQHELPGIETRPDEQGDRRVVFVAG